MSKVTYTAIANDGFVFQFRIDYSDRIGFGLTGAVSWRDESGEWVPATNRGSDNAPSALRRTAQDVLNDIDSLGGTDPSYVVSVIRNEGSKSIATR